MNGAGTIAALAALTLLAGSAAARGGLGTYTCVDRAGSLASDGSACRNWVNPCESAASAAERRNAAWLKRYPDERAYEAKRQAGGRAPARSPLLQLSYSSSILE